MRPGRRAALPDPQPGDAFLAGGTWLFSEPQPGLRRLVDLPSLGWTSLSAGAEGLEIGATCRLAELETFEPRAEWAAAALFGPCCNALWGSFKIRNVATVGGNLCLALPAAPMAALAVALQGVCVIWMPGGGERRLQARDFITGAGETALRAGEILRAVHLPAAALRRRAVLRQASLTCHGRSAALLIGTLDAAEGSMSLTVTASVRRPLRLDFPSLPDADGLQAALSGMLDPDRLHDDLHGAADWKRLMTLRLAEAIRRELAA
ncbi:FAD binding domain-containing protein [Lichenicoccus sp.]|uniref:FAD binding domain-containing protein n=1 Tax=Lichenicoccus sp. TaxID=2781899 RepID=UPI003D110A7C